MENNNNNIIGCIQKLIENSKNNFHRECVVLAGNHEWCDEIIGAINNALDLSHSISISSQDYQLPKSTTANIGDALHYLGHEYSHAIVNCHDGIDPSALGAISGTVRGGGLFILLIPALDSLDTFSDPEKKRMAIWPHDATDVHNRFLARFKFIVEHSSLITLITKQGITTNQTTSAGSTGDLSAYLKDNACVTLEQQAVVDAILQVVDGHRRRPLVITADRGRGKSSALGIASAKLLLRGGHNVIATGPRYSATEKIFEHAANLVQESIHNNTVEHNNSSLCYLSVDEICIDNPKCSLLIVDEAASIPVSLLTKLLNHYSRIVFSSTTYGYEGTGRGFNLRFFKTLDSTTPNWKHIELNTPIRWAAHDPLEEFIFKLLCLHAEPPEVPTEIDHSKIEYLPVDRDRLMNNEEQLSAIFGLLVLAHYKTQPRDLRYLLDSLDLEIFIAKSGNTILAAILVELEGGLDSEISAQIYKNKRRVQGHLLPQSLESTIGIKNASHLRFMRVIRIIVHPDCQRHGIGKQLLAFTENHVSQHYNHKIDAFGANFGTSGELLRFWNSAGYIPVHIGLKPNTSTGTHSISFIKPASILGEQLVNKCKSLFSSKLNYLLASAYKDLDTDLVEYLYATYSADENLLISDRQKEEVVNFSHSLIGYAMVSQALNLFIHRSFYDDEAQKKLTLQEKKLLITRVLQQHSWESVVSSLDYSGKNQAIQCLRIAVAKLIDHYKIEVN